MKKKKCKQGHELTKENTYVRKEGYHQCKKCRCLSVKNYYLKNPDKHKGEYYREYNRNYNLSGKSLISSQKWIKNNPEKYKAHNLMSSATRNKSLIRLPCEICKDVKADGHHPDYTKPLEVIWLCRLHHKEQHAKEKLLKIS